jgi:hypothetical protein
MLTHVRRGQVAIEHLAQVVAMPLAVGLRRVDVGGTEVLRALIDAGHDRVVALDDVPLAKQSIQELLADPTFDRVGELAVAVKPNNLDNLLTAMIADRHQCLARVPRRVRLTGPGIPLDRVFERWHQLPVASIVAEGVTLERAGATTRAALDARVAPEVRAALRRRLPDAELAG